MSAEAMVFASRDPLVDKKYLHNFAPHTIHIFRDMHMVVTFLQLAVVCITAIAFVQMDLWRADYFSFGPPIAIREDTITGTTEFWVLWGLFLFDRMIASLSAQTIGNWRDHVEGSAPKGKRVYGYWTVMWIVFVDFTVGWLRYSITVVFMFAQASFGIAFFAGDFVVHLFITKCRIEKMERERWKTRPKDGLGTCEAILETVDPLHMSLVEFFIALPLLITAFFVSGYAKTSYFAFGPPVSVLGVSITETWIFALLVVYSFVDQLVASTVIAAFGGWETSEVHNNAVADLKMSHDKVRMLLYVRIVCKWIREVLVISLTLSQFIFTLAFYAADLLVRFSTTYQHIVKHALDKSQFTEGVRLMAEALPNKAWALVALAAECAVILIITGASGLFSAPYFNFPPPLTLFSSQFVITQNIFIAILSIVVVIDRVVATLTRDIITPYLINVIYGVDPEGVDYGKPALFIIAVNNFYSWARRIVSFNFILANILFAILSAAADIIVTVAIDERNLDYKRRMLRRARDLSQIDDINAREREAALVEARGLPPPSDHLSKDEDDELEENQLFAIPGYREKFRMLQTNSSGAGPIIL